MRACAADWKGGHVKGGVVKNQTKTVGMVIKDQNQLYSFACSQLRWRQPSSLLDYKNPSRPNGGLFIQQMIAG